MLVLAGLTGIAMFHKISTYESHSPYAISWIDMALGIFAGAVQLICSLAFVYVIYARFHAAPDRGCHGTSFGTTFGFQGWAERKMAAVLALILPPEKGVSCGPGLITRQRGEQPADHGSRGRCVMAPENTMILLDIPQTVVRILRKLTWETQDEIGAQLHDNF